VEYRYENILDAAASIWDVVAYAELTEQAIFFLSLEFASAFDRV